MALFAGLHILFMFFNRCQIYVYCVSQTVLAVQAFVMSFIQACIITLSLLTRGVAVVLW